MNLRHDAHCILAAAQTALRSGEWIPSDETVVVRAVSALEAALGGVVPMSEIRTLFDDVCEQIGHAVTMGDWFPGDWASEWQGCYVGDVVRMRKSGIVTMALAA